jgi:hypothetical protein
MFIQGATGSFPPRGIGLMPEHKGSHTWLGVTGIGHLDLSPNLGVGRGGWRPLNVVGAVGEDWPLEHRHKLVICASSRDYENEVNRATHARDEAVAVYLLDREEPFRSSMITDESAFVDSPLSSRLRRERKASVYVALALHLRDFLAGKAGGLAGVKRRKRWAIVDSRPENEIAAAEAHIRSVADT